MSELPTIVHESIRTRKELIALKNTLSELFRKHCIKCEGGCCCKQAEFTVFHSELEKLPVLRDKLTFRKQWGGKSQPQDRRVERITMAKHCPFLEADKGCVLDIGAKPLDCLSYPIYPIIKYHRDENKEIVGMMIHRSCPLAEEMFQDIELVNIMRIFWEKELKKFSKTEIRQWFGGKRNYWLDRNLIKLMNEKPILPTIAKYKL